MPITRRPISRPPPTRRLRRQAARRRGLAGLLGAVALVLVLAGAMLWGLGDIGTRPIGGPFALVNTDGVSVTDRAFRGRYMLVYFGYTTCPDVCPTTLHEMAGALDRLGPHGAQVQPVFITVDPRRDTPAVLGDYVAAIDPHLVALTGRDDAIAAVLRAYRVQRDFRPAPHHGDYLVDHSSVLYLMGPDGRFVAPVRADAPADRMAAEIAAHLS
jgi:protein SCO1/2